MLVHSIFNKKQTFTYYSIEEMMKMQQLNHLQLRETNPGHVSKIRKYVVDNFLNNTIYFPPIVACIELSECFTEDKPSRLIIIDGSSRLQALTDFDQTILKLISSDEEQLQRKGFLLKYRLREMNVAVQIFEGLSEDEINQLYVDLNSKGKKVALSKRISNDSRDAVNVATNQIMRTHEGLKRAGIEVERAAVIRPHNQKFLSLSQLRTLVVFFLTGKTVANNLYIESYGQKEFEATYELLCIWFDELFLLCEPEDIGNYHETILASFTVILAIAHYAIQGLDDVMYKDRELLVKKRMHTLQAMDWTRDQETWLQFEGDFKGKEQYYYLNQNKRTVSSIVEWLIREGGE